MRKKNNDRINKSDERKAVFPVAVWSVMLIWVSVFFVMYVWAFSAANKSIINFFMDSVWLPQKEFGGWQWKNWLQVFTDMKIRISSGEWVYFPRMLLNTLIYVIGYGFVSV